MKAFTHNTEGVFHGLPAADYHAAPGFSNSMGKNMEPTPQHLVQYLKEGIEPTPAMILGTLVHSAILEPANPLPQIAVPPETYPAPADCSAVKQKKAAPGDPLDWSWSAKYCKAWRQNHEAKGVIVLSQSEFDTLEGCVTSVARHPVCRKIFEKGKSEVSVFKNFTLGQTVLRKARLDFVPEGNFLTDIKTCQDASVEAFSRTIFDNDYHCQAASNLDIWNDANPDDRKDAFLFIAVEKKPPYLVAVYQLDSEDIGLGRATHIRRLQTYMECVASGKWPGYPEHITPIRLPAFARPKQIF